MSLFSSCHTSLSSLPSPRSYLHLIRFPLIFDVGLSCCLLVIFNFLFIFTSNPPFIPYSLSSWVFFTISSFLLPLSLPSRSSRTAWTPTCPETACCGIPSLVVSMHSPSTQLTLPSSLFTTPCWVSVDLDKLRVWHYLLRCCCHFV